MPETTFKSHDFTAAITDWETAYSNRRAIPDMGDWLTESTRRSAAFLEDYKGSRALGISYGRGPRQVVDIFEPLAAVEGTLIFIHGGYWRATSTSDHHHFAAGALAQGWRVAFVEYPLCPTVTLGEIARAAAAAVERILEHAPEGEVVLSGHSAGGHLATWLGSTASTLSATALARIGRIVSLSGLHDLRPLVGATELNADLRLDDEQAASLSPVLARPAATFELLCICGGGELPEFRRQNALLTNIWTGFGLATTAAELGDVDHFRLLDHMIDPDGILARVLTNEELEKG